MPRFSNTKDTPLEFRKRNSQAGTRYRESGLVLRHTSVIHNFPHMLSRFTHRLAGQAETCFRLHFEPCECNWLAAVQAVPVDAVFDSL